MAIAPDYNILVLGMGHIGKFLQPAYRMLLGDKVETNVFGVRNNPDPEKLAELQAMVPFKVSAGNAAELLREKKPDIVIVATPPKTIPGVAANLLKPYFEEARANGWNLPDIYTFGPTPAPQMYLDLMGDDVLVAKFLPSMAEAKKGVPLEKLGAGFLVFGADNWPEDRKQRAIDVSNMFSQSFICSQDMSLLGLASKITTYTISDCVCAIVDGLAKRGIEADVNDIASCWRAAFRKYTGLEGEGMYPCSEEDAPECIREFVAKVCAAWYDGILRYILSQGCEEELGRSFHGASFEVFSLAAQLADRAELERDMQKRATGGGVTEKGVMTYRSYFTEHLIQATCDYLDGKLNVSFYDTAEGIAYTIDMTVNRHAYRLAVK